MHLGLKVRRTGGPSAVGDRLDGGAADTGPMAVRRDRELRDVPAAVADAKQTKADDVAVRLD